MFVTKKGFKIFITKNWLIILSAIFCSFIYSLPQFIFLFQNRADHALLYSPNDAEVHYLSRVNEVKEGDNSYSSTYLYEYKGTNPPVLQYGEVIYGNLIKFLNIDVADFYLLAKPLFVFINFLLWFYFLFLVVKKKNIALLSVLIIFLASGLLEGSFLKNIFSIIFWETDKFETLVYGRFVNPLLSYPFLLFGLIRFYFFYTRQSVKNAVYLGLALGATFYVYFYFWFYLFTLSGVLFIYYLIKKNFLAVKKILLAFFTAFILGYYYLAEMAQVFNGGIADATSGTLNAFDNIRVFIFSSVVISASFLFFCFLVGKYRRKVSFTSGEIFITLMLVASILVTNQQVLSGVLIEEGHFHWYINKPISIFVLTYLAVLLFEKYFQNLLFRRIAFATVLLFIFAVGAGVQASGYKKSAPLFVSYNRYAESLLWLRENTEKSTVVLANDEISELIPAYTENYVYYSRTARLYQSNPLERRIDAANLYFRLENGDREINEDEIFAQCQAYVYYLYGYLDHKECPDWLVEKIGQDYQDDAFGKPLSELLNKYRLDYIMWDRAKDQEWKVNEWGIGSEVFRDEDIFIYKIK